jgi:hypothetical protein
MDEGLAICNLIQAGDAGDLQSKYIHRSASHGEVHVASRQSKSQRFIRAAKRIRWLQYSVPYHYRCLLDGPDRRYRVQML